MHHHKNHHAGFTLIELSMVLVIIALMVGGVLAGQHLMHAAEIRSIAPQVRQYNAAKNVFRDKYDQLPGDGVRLAEFGMTTGSSGQARSDGDGRTPDARHLGCETALFWLNLVEAGLVGFSLDVALIDADAVMTVSPNDVWQVLPESDVRQSRYYHVFPSRGYNYFYFGGIRNVTAGAFNEFFALTPLEARKVDDKFDDGRPNTGHVVAMDDVHTITRSASTPENGGTGDCTEGVGVSDIYNTDEGLGNAGTSGDGEIQACNLRIRMN
jgi:prepilin-type N-terminal cleavage/methylation domain-containing protein